MNRTKVLRAAAMAALLALPAAWALPGMAAEVKPNTGLWEIFTTVGTGKKQVEKECITPAELKDWALFKRVEDKCQEQCKIGDGKIDCTTTCTYDRAKVEGTLKGTYSATSYQIEMKSASTAEGKVKNNTALITGKFLSASCAGPVESSGKSGMR